MKIEIKPILCRNFILVVLLLYRGFLLFSVFGDFNEKIICKIDRKNRTFFFILQFFRPLYIDAIKKEEEIKCK